MPEHVHELGQGFNVAHMEEYVWCIHCKKKWSKVEITCRLNATDWRAKMSLGEQIRVQHKEKEWPGRTMLDWADQADGLETERDAWKEAFAATRSYYRNNTGANAKRYREAIKDLKERKLIR